MSGLFRPLRADEIECRVQSVKQNGLVLLLYKDARCDQNILDETVGPMNWQRSHSRDNANCTVSLWDKDKSQWISKEDMGTESNTEERKGLASDSFKRACFNWGLGRELYTAPFTWISKGNYNEAINKGKPACFDRFSVREIEYSDAGTITKLVIYNETLKRECFRYGAKPQTPQQSQPKPYQHYTCERCGNPVQPVQTTTGKTASPDKVVANSRKEFGGATYCFECQKKLKAERANREQTGN